MDFTKFFSRRSAQSERTVVSTTLSASSSLSRIPIKRNSSLRRNKEVMENYNNLQADETNQYPVSGHRDEYNELIDLDTRQSFSSSKDLPIASKQFPSTPTETRNVNQFSTYQTEDGNIASLEEHHRQEFLRSHTKKPEISLNHSSPTKGNKTGLTR